MERKEAIEKLRESIKNLLSFSKEEKEEVKLQEVSTKDGKTLSTPSEKIDVNSEIYQIDEEGNQIPVEDGSYELEDGTTIEVKGGIVAEIAQSSEEKSEEMEDEKPEEDKPEEEKVDEEKPEEEEKKEEEQTADPETEKRISDLEATVAELITIVQSMVEKSQEMSTKVEEFASQPAADKIKNKVIERKLTDEEIRIQRFLDVQQSLKNKK